MRMNNTDDSYASLQTSRQKAIMLPILRKRDEGGKLVRIDPRTVVIKKQKR